MGGAKQPAAGARPDRPIGKRQSHHAPPALELVHRFMRTAVLANFVGDLTKKARQPATLAALERRWFCGRQSLKKAMEKHSRIDLRLLDSPTLGGNIELIGVSSMLSLAEAGRKCRSEVPLVTVQPSLVAPGWTEFILRVPVGLRGNNQQNGAAKHHARMDWKINGAAMGQKTYYVHDSVVAAGYRYIEFVAQQTAADPMPVKPVNVETETHSADRQDSPTKLFRARPSDPGGNLDVELPLVTPFTSSSLASSLQVEMQATGPNDDLGQCHATCHEIEDPINPSMVWTRDPVPAGPPDRKFTPLYTRSCRALSLSIFDWQPI